MVDSPVWVYLIGFAGMTIYGSRILIQWYMSEKSHRVESPGIYWVLASVAAVVLYVYGWLRKDLSIIFGESLGYYIYMWNIKVLGLYKRVPRSVIVLQAIFPLLILALIIRDFPTFSAAFLHNEDVPLKLLIFGLLGQFVYETRTVYQFVYSYRYKGSFLPFGHWVLAVVGSLMIIAYGIIRHDWVLAVGQCSIFFSIRNLMLSYASRRIKMDPSLRRKYVAEKVLMVRPAFFRYNEQTAVNNLFQHDDPDREIQKYAVSEFDGMVHVLREHDIPVMVLEDRVKPMTPDSVFPNNWFSTHKDGTLVLYPMFAYNRRNERRPYFIRAIRKAAGTRRLVDLTGWEEQGKFLEGTGSMVLDRATRTAYACRSPRTSEEVLKDFCSQMGYRPVIFDALDRNGNPVYHTNVVLSIGTEYAVICKEAIPSRDMGTQIERDLIESGRRVVNISYSQMLCYAGNILEVRNTLGESFIVMSDTAYACLGGEQLKAIAGNATVLPVHIPHIETVGGGSARCMLAEIFAAPPQKAGKKKSE